jgi:hypothetical protein
MQITGYPNFSRLTDQEVAQQFKLVWDALIKQSADVEAISVPDVTALTTGLAEEQKLRQTLGREVAALKASPVCHVANTADTTISTATWTFLTFDATQHDNAGMFRDNVTPNRIVFLEAGVYCVGFQLLFEANATGQRTAVVLRDIDHTSFAATDIDAHARLDAQVVSTGLWSPPFTRRYEAGSYVALAVYQTSGGDLDVLGAGRTDSPRFWAFKVAD